VRTRLRQICGIVCTVSVYVLVIHPVYDIKSQTFVMRSQCIHVEWIT
jgi:hypothetical protein